MSTRGLAHRLHYSAYFVLSRGIRCLPHRGVRAVGRLLGRAAYRLLPDRRRLTLQNLAGAFPSRTPAAHEAIGRGCFEHFGGSFLEALSVARYRPSEIDDVFAIEGLHHLERAQQSGRGLLLFTGHYGSWDMAAYPLGRRIGDMHVLVRRQNNPYVADDVERLRRRTGAMLLPRHQSAHRMLNVLRDNGTVAMTIDQRVRPSEGVLVPFLGRLAWTTSIPAQLSVATRAPALPVFCVPTDGGRYRVTFQAPIEPEARGEAEVFRLTRRYTEVIEEAIASAPELWFWPHTRWQRSARYRRPRAIARLAATSGLPDGPALTELEGSGDEVRRRLLDMVAEESYVESCRHLAIVSGSAPQRTAVAGAFGRAMVAAGHSLLYTRLDALLESLAASRSRAELPTRLRKDDARALVIVDGIGLETLDGDALELFGTFLAHRRARGSLVLAADLDARRLAAAAGPGAAELRSFVDAATRLTLPAPDPVAAGRTPTAPPPAPGDGSDTPGS